MLDIAVTESVVTTQYRDGVWYPAVTEYVVTLSRAGLTVMTFHTSNREEADTIGPELVAFLGY